jgi:20S proteasome alpha/beta subunit
MFQRFKEDSFIAAEKYKNAIQWLSYRDHLEDITKKLNRRYGRQEYEFEVLMAGQGQYIDGTTFAMLYHIQINGTAHPVKKYRAIGSGIPYGSIFLKKLCLKEKSMQDIAELGYFIIRNIEENELDIYVGLDKRHPQICYIPNQGEVREE